MVIEKEKESSKQPPEQCQSETDRMGFLKRLGSGKDCRQERRQHEDMKVF
jgi:hypothetical protein